MKHLIIFAALAMAAPLAGCDDADESPPSSGSNTLKLNEILAASETGPDWLELYNPGDQDVDLTGYELRDSSNFWVFRQGNIAAGGFLQVICDGSGTAGRTSFKLTSKGEQVSLHDPEGKQLDRVVFPALSKETSWARVPDGDGEWKSLATPSPGRSNTGSAASDGGLARDTGTTTKPDAGTTTNPDAGTTTNPDAGTTTNPDAGTTTNPDAGSPDLGSPDSGISDGGPVVDALLDGPISDSAISDSIGD